MKKKISIGDIAQHLGVSKTTVSFILNGKARNNHISESLEERVLKYMEEVGYKPNHLAQGLRTGKTKIIGMLVEEISDPFFSSVARIVEEKAYERGYKIFYSSSENKTEKARELINIYRSRQVDGYIIAPTPDLEEDIQSLQQDGFPVILFDRYMPGLPTDTVVVNNFQGTYEAIQHLIQNGYGNIGFVTLVSTQIQMQDRLDGYLKALEVHSLPHFIKPISFEEQPQQIVKEIQAFLKQNKAIDALFFGTNYLAESGLEAIRNLKLSIPNKIGVVVFDDSNLFRLFSPSITAIAQPIQEMSEQVISLLLARLDGIENLKAMTKIVVPTKLIIRDSSIPKIKNTQNIKDSLVK